MRARAALVALVAISALLTASACSSAGSTQSGASDSASSTAEPGSDTSSGDVTSSSPAPAGPSLPADTEVAAPVDRAQMPEATGAFGEKATITVPDTPPPDSLQRIILSDGDGAETQAGDTVVVDYVGQVWGGEVFDNSYDRGAPLATQIGGAQRQVVVGWDIGLQGVKAGSRVLLSFPPRDGYGAQGSAPSISGTDTLIFVIDVIDVYPADQGGQTDAVPQQIPAGWPTVGGDLGALPTLTIPSSLPEPAAAGTTLVARGSGDPAQDGTVLVQYIAVAWDGSHSEQSWPDPTGADPLAGTGPQSFPLSTSSAFAALLGAPIGSRVLMRTPADPNTGIPAAAWVVDLIAQTSVTDGN